QFFGPAGAEAVVHRRERLAVVGAFEEAFARRAGVDRSLLLRMERHAFAVPVVESTADRAPGLAAVGAAAQAVLGAGEERERIVRIEIETEQLLRARQSEVELVPRRAAVVGFEEVSESSRDVDRG